MKKKETNPRVKGVVSYLEKKFSYTAHSNIFKEYSNNFTQIELTNTESKEELKEKKNVEEKVLPKKINPIIEEDSEMLDQEIPGER